ncbi:MAG: hypothetical protein ABI720_03670 [Actinomycetes bacterium]
MMRLRTLVVISSAVVIVAGCGSSGVAQVEKMTETLVRTAASTQGQAELAAVGVEVSGPLSCQTTPKGDDFEVSCTGKALDGRDVTVVGTATSLPGGSSVEGTFVGTAAGTQVFAIDCLGC